MTIESTFIKPGELQGSGEHTDFFFGGCNFNLLIIHN
jgi:hypothetical protein